MDGPEVVSLIDEQDGAGYLRVESYEAIPGLAYDPKSAVHFNEMTLEGCRKLCDRRNAECSVFTYNAKKQKCRLSKEHLGYDPDFVMDQKGDKPGLWDTVPGLTGYSKGYLRIETKTREACKDACAKAPTCAVVSYREKDGLCLVSGRGLQLDGDWTYYEKESVAHNAKGFVLPVVETADHKEKESQDVELLRLRAQVAATQKLKAENDKELTEATKKEKAVAAKVKAEVGKVSQLDTEIAKAKTDMSNEEQSMKRKTAVEVQTEGIEAKKQAGIVVSGNKLQDGQVSGAAEVHLAEQKASEEVALAKQKALVMMETAKDEAEKHKYQQQIKEANAEYEEARKSEKKMHGTAEEMSERAVKKEAMHAEVRQAEAAQSAETLRAQRLSMTAKIARIEKEAEGAGSSVRGGVTRSVANKVMDAVNAAKIHLKTAETAYEHTVAVSKMRDAGHELRVQYWKAQLAKVTKTTDKLRAEALDVDGETVSTLSKIKMEMAATKEGTSDRKKQMKLREQAETELSQIKQQQANAQKLEQARFLERQREAQEEADKQARDLKAQRLADQHAKTAQMEASAKMKKVVKIADEASKLDNDQAATQMLSAANKDYANFAEKENEKLTTAATAPVIVSKKHAALESKTLTFDTKNPSLGNIEVKESPP